MDCEGTEEHFVLEKYEIESDAEIQLELLRKYKNFRNTEVEISDDISSVELLKMESDTQQETQERNILSSIPILKFIVEKKIDVLTADNENNLRTSQPKKTLYQCQKLQEGTPICKAYIKMFNS